MVANFRCTEIKAEAVEKVQAQVNALKIDSEKEVLADFQRRCTAIIMEATKHFEENANQYQGVVFNKVMLELQA